MSQTAYAILQSAAFAGMLYDLGNHEVLSYLSNNSGTVPFGVALKRVSGQDGQADLPSAAADDIIGVSLASATKEIPQGGGSQTVGWKRYDSIPVLRRGRVYVSVEAAVDPSKTVYFRITANGGNAQLGNFRADEDGTAAMVVTITPTAVDSAIYWVQVGAKQYEITADGSATATEIVTAFKTAINADSAVHGVVASGTTTLILTGSVSGRVFSWLEGANMSAVVTTPAVATAVAWAKAKFLSTTSGAGVALLEVNI